MILTKKKKKSESYSLRICGSKNGDFGGIFGILLDCFERIYVIFDVLAPTAPHNHDEYPPKT